MSFPTSIILIEDEEMKQPLAPTSTEMIFAPPVQLSSCGPEAHDLYRQELQRDVMGLVAQAFQQIETERVQKLEAEQKAKLSAQNAEQHVSQMQSAMIAEVDRIKRDAEAFQTAASEQVRTVVATAERRLSDASVTNSFLQGQIEQLEKEKAEAERKNEQRSTRGSVASAHSTYDMSTPQSTPRAPFEKVVPDYFQSLWTFPNSPPKIFAPTATMTAPAQMQGQTEQKPLPVPSVRMTG